MTRSRLAGLAAAAMLMAACGNKDAQTGAAPADSATTAAPAAPAPEAATPTGIGGTPAAAQRAVDSADAASARQMSAVDSLSQQASGGATP